MGSVARKWLGKGAGVANSNLSAERQLASSWATSQGLARLPAALAKELEKGMPGKVKATDGLLKVLMSPDPKTSAIPILSTWSPPGAWSTMVCALAGTGSTSPTKWPALLIDAVLKIYSEHETRLVFPSCWPLGPHSRDTEDKC